MRPTNIILVDITNREAVAAALILVKLLTPLLAHDARQIPSILTPEDQVDEMLALVISKVTGTSTTAPTQELRLNLILLCTTGCFAGDYFLLNLLYFACLAVESVVPMVASEDFQFPTDTFYTTLEASVAALCLSSGAVEKPKLLTAFVKSIFEKIFSRFSTMGNIETLELQAKMIWRNIEQARCRLSEGTMSEEDLAIVLKITSEHSTTASGALDNRNATPTAAQRLAREESKYSDSGDELQCN